MVVCHTDAMRCNMYVAYGRSRLAPVVRHSPPSAHNGEAPRHYVGRSGETGAADGDADGDAAELDRLARLVGQLKADDAAKELRIAHLSKTRADEREVRETLEIALEAKQQELELVRPLSMSFIADPARPSLPRNEGEVARAQCILVLPPNRQR